MNTTFLMSSYGLIVFDADDGYVVDFDLDDEFGPVPVKIDVEEWKRRYPGELPGGGTHDVLDFGYWYADGRYEEPAEGWRTDREENIKRDCGMITKHDIIRHCSGNFLCEPFPEDFEHMTEDAVLEFIADNCWNPLEFMPDNDLLEVIHDSADAMAEFLREHGVEVRG